MPECDPSRSGIVSSTGGEMRVTQITPVTDTAYPGHRRSFFGNTVDGASSMLAMPTHVSMRRACLDSDV
ncbi:hypothetical protein D3C81_1623010 [compost metagenome]